MNEIALFGKKIGMTREFYSSGKSVEKSDDPIRMYLREMGGVELLSREGEILSLIHI